MMVALVAVAWAVSGCSNAPNDALGGLTQRFQQQRTAFTTLAATIDRLTGEIGLLGYDAQEDQLLFANGDRVDPDQAASRHPDQGSALQQVVTLTTDLGLAYALIKPDEALWLVLDWGGLTGVDHGLIRLGREPITHYRAFQRHQPLPDQPGWFAFVY